jgi:ubiquitin-protein ligase
MSVRVRRLQAEYARVRALFASHPRIRIVEAAGDPPDRYVVEYQLTGLVEEAGELKERQTHRAQIVLPTNYPRQRPRCEMLTPVFHPNIDPLGICTEDIGAAGQTLDQAIVFIGEMIAFQAYNVQSPRNAEAARWTLENLDRVPLDRVDLTPASLMSAPAGAAGEPVRMDRVQASAGPAACSNCGRETPATQLTACAHQHLLCPDCVLACKTCGRFVCIVCRVIQCGRCQEPLCANCAIRCVECSRAACAAHARSCAACSSNLCIECVRQCARCGRDSCRAHLDAAGRCTACSAPSMRGEAQRVADDATPVMSPAPAAGTGQTAAPREQSRAGPQTVLRPIEPPRAVRTTRVRPPTLSRNGDTTATPWTLGAALPRGVHAVFLLVDIGSPARETRGIPRPWTITHTRSLIGRHASASIHLDDEQTIRPRHAIISYGELDGYRGFILHAVDEATVLVNQTRVPLEGRRLNSGDRLRVGSAEAIFFVRLRLGQ